MSIFGAATIAMAVGGLAEPAVSQAVWDIGAYDSCEKAAHDRWIRENRTNQQLRDDLRFCCDRSGGEWSQTQGMHGTRRRADRPHPDTASERDTWGHHFHAAKPGDNETVTSSKVDLLHPSPELAAKNVQQVHTRRYPSPCCAGQ